MLNNLASLEKELICPVCRSPVRLVDRKFWCIDAGCRRSYPIDEYDIPQMLESEATVEAEPAPIVEEPPGRSE